VKNWFVNFESGAFNHSATLPTIFYQALTQLQSTTPIS